MRARARAPLAASLRVRTRATRRRAARRGVQDCAARAGGGVLAQAFEAYWTVVSKLLAGHAGVIAYARPCSTLPLALDVRNRHAHVRSQACADAHTRARVPATGIGGRARACRARTRRTGVCGGLLGRYEVLNEPWLGDHVSQPALLAEAGAAEARAVGPFMQAPLASPSPLAHLLPSHSPLPLPARL